MAGQLPANVTETYSMPDRINRAALVSGLGPLDRPGTLDGMSRGEARTMMLARRPPLLARGLVGAAVTAERFRAGTVYRGLCRPCQMWTVV